MSNETRYPVEALDHKDEDDGTMPANVAELEQVGFTKWHIYADMGDVMELDVEWSCGNPFYYGYGFDIVVEPFGGVDHAD